MTDIEQFEYDLPPELIAQYPLAVRHESRLLVLEKGTGALAHKRFADIVDILRADDVLVVNNTRVIPTRLIAKRSSGGQIKMLLLKSDSKNPAIWEALVTPIKRIKVGEELFVDTTSGAQHKIVVNEIFTAEDGFKRLKVDLGTRTDLFNLLSEIGKAPLPPYIHRQGDDERQSDLDRYQTVYASAPGAVAAPTAGLHFSDEVLERLRSKGVDIEQITLHVGPGTFKPIADSVAAHTIEPETYSIEESTALRINQARKDGRRIIAVGTTTLRALESAGANGTVASAFNQSTSLYVRPGYEFRIVTGMVTNFHLSRSSLLVLVCALAGRENIMRAYREAIDQRYRFFSYGDAMLIL